MRFGDPVTLTTGTHSQLAVFLWRANGEEPVVFLNGRVVRPDLDAIFTPWRCSTCQDTRIVWAIRIPPQCATCHPFSITEREFVLAYVTGAVRHLANKLDDPNAKALMYAQLDEAVSTGDVRQLVRLSLEMLAGSFILKHELGDLL